MYKNLDEGFFLFLTGDVYLSASPLIFMKQYAETFYKSTRWQDCRNSYMKKVGGLCELCLKEGKITPAEEVHHKIHLSPQNINDPTVTLNYGNLIALCREHHRQEHGARKRRYKIDEWGRVTPI